MERQEYKNCIRLLEQELVPALGCTEPSAVAYAAALARDALGRQVQHLSVGCSGNILKNVKGVCVPNSGGMKGVEAAAALGAVHGAAERKLEVLAAVGPAHITQAKAFLAQGRCTCHLLPSPPLLHIVVRAEADGVWAEAEIRDHHTNVTRVTVNGQDHFRAAAPASGDVPAPDPMDLSVRLILEFADILEIDDVEEVLERQVRLNSAISAEGLAHPWGVGVGQMLLEAFGTDIKNRARAAAAAGSDARMGGCTLPVIINSGSGNQGITVSLPVVEYARALGCGRDRLYRALALANLLSIHQKKYIGSLSAYCGAASAGCAAACGIAYLHGAGYEELCATITNTLCDIGGMVCDGAKASCAAKIAAAVDAGLMGWELARRGRRFGGGEGLVADNGDVEQTIRNVGRMGREGMYATDQEILSIMVGH